MEKVLKAATHNCLYITNYLRFRLFLYEDNSSETKFENYFLFEESSPGSRILGYTTSSRRLQAQAREKQRPILRDKEIVGS